MLASWDSRARCEKNLTVTWNLLKKKQKKTDDYDISEHTMVFFFLQRAAKLLISTIFSTVSGEE